MTAPYTLGIDGAPKAGAEVLLNPRGHAVGAVVWETEKHNGVERLVVRYADQRGIRGRYYPTSHLDLARFCHMSLRDYVVGSLLQMAMEDVFIGQNPRSACQLLKVDGLLASPWHPKTGEQTWVSIGTWRKVSFPRGWTKTYRRESDPKGHSRAAKRCSLAVMPTLVPGLAKLLDSLGKIDHITDAAGVARSHWLKYGG